MLKMQKINNNLIKNNKYLIIFFQYTNSKLKMPPKKTPSGTEKPATKTTKKSKSGPSDGKRHKRRIESFSIYIYKVLR